MGKFLCKSCGSEIKRALVALSWPSSIRCKRCSAKHTVNHAWILGLGYSLFLLVLVFGSKLLIAGMFETRHGNIYSVGPLQAALQLVGPFVAIVGGGFLYTWVLGRFFGLRRPGP